MAPYDDFESVAEPALSDFESVGPVADFQSVGPATTETGGQITAENYGRVAAARIAKARRERETAGQEDLNQNEQAAIMDAYRQVAGLPTLSNVDTFKEAQKHIAEHQSAILNLARSTSAAFERQAVDLVSPAVDLIAPGWGTSTRQDIAAMNPYQSDSVTGKIGGLVASAPLILAGGSMKAAAGIFGLESAAGSLATSEDTGVTGEKKWGAAAGEGAITAGSILAGGKLGEWATKGLAERLPQLKALLTAGDQDGAARIITREAALAGINLPVNGAAMFAGTIGNNLLAQQTTDPKRQWDDGLGDAAYEAAAITLSLHLVHAANSLAARQSADPSASGVPAEDTETRLAVLRAQIEQIDAETGAIKDRRESLAGMQIATPESTAPKGPEPVIVTDVSVPNTAGTGTDPRRVYIDKAVPATLEISGKPVDIHGFLALHETTERDLEDAGMPDDEAHAHATAAEHDALRRAGIDPAAYERALDQYEQTAAKTPLTKAPSDLDTVPYQKPTPAVPRPPDIVTQERDIHQTPDGFQVATPHLTYDLAHKMSSVQSGDTKGENLWMRPSGDSVNAERQLLVQFSTDLINAGRPKTLADDYGAKLYDGSRPGYSKPPDFWELPQWIGVAAKNLPNADVYVVRNLAEAQKFLAEAKYGTVAMSALDVNSKLAQSLISKYDGKVAIGGYTDMAPFTGRSNVKVYKAMPDFIRDQGQTFKDGTDYRHFRGTEVVPRLSLSEGCLHNCDFCGVEGKGHAPTEAPPKSVDAQIDAFKDLNHRLVYINDKTFWQAANSSTLPDIFARIKKQNPAFEGFVVQTSAAMMKKVTPEMIRKSGVRYIELGVESYNDSILKSVKKPANEAMIDEAVQKIHDGGAKFIPNVMIGLPGETPTTYAHTLDFLERNKDVISHVNAYNVALYGDSALAKKVGGAKTEADTNENMTRKSWQATPEVDQAFHDQVMAFGSKALDSPATPPETAAAPLPDTPPGLMERLTSDETGSLDPAKLARALVGEPDPKDTRTLAQRGRDLGRAIVNEARAASGRMFPEMVRRSPELADAAARFVAAKNAAPERADFIARAILGQGREMVVDPAESHRLGTALAEDRLRARSIRLARAGQIDEAAKVGTLIGKANSPFRTDAEYDAYLANPRTRELLANVEQHWGPERDDLYQKVSGGADSRDLKDPDLRTHVFMNMVPLADAESSPTAIEVRPRSDAETKAILSKAGFSAGNLLNTMRRKASIQRKFSGTAAAYETDLHEMIKATLLSSSEIAERNAFIDAGVKAGQMVEGKTGEIPPLLNGEKVLRLPDVRRLITDKATGQTLAANRDIGVRQGLYDEVRGAFNVDSKSFSRAFEPISRILNSLALAGPTEMMWHSANLLRPIWKYYGIRTPFKLAADALKLWRHDFAAQGVLADLVREGVSVGRTGDPTGNILRRTTSKALDFIGRVSHLALEDAYNKIVQSHPELDAPSARRDFHNQTGNYNERAMPHWTVAVKRTIGPFLTAGLTRLTRSVRNLGLSPGFRTPDLATSIRLRLNVLGNYASLLALIPAINYLTSGRVDGGDDVPWGAIRLPDSADGKHNYFDLLQIIGVRSGLKATGANALLEQGHTGRTGVETGQQALTDVYGQVKSPFAGPLVRTLLTAAGDSPYIPHAAKDESQPWLNFKTAIKDVNPAIGWLTGTKGSAGTLSAMLGPYAPRTSAGKTTAEQIASREAAARVPVGQQTRTEMNQTQAEHSYREAWAHGDHQPLIQALHRGDINQQTATRLVKESRMSSLARTVYGLSIEAALRVYDAGTPAQKADLRLIMLEHLDNLWAKSPLKVAALIPEYKKRGLL